MSKSLKNFTTVRQALARGEWTPRSLRIAFLLGVWHSGVEVTEGLVKEGAGWEDKVNNFFLKARSAEVRLAQATNGNTNGVSSENDLSSALAKAQETVRASLLDSFDTKGAMQAISELITDYNSAPKSSATDQMTLKIASWITEMVRMFGLDTEADVSASGIGWSGLDIPELAKPFVIPASVLRDAVRQRAKSGLLVSEDMLKLTDDAKPAEPTTGDAEPFARVLSEFQQSVRKLAEDQASAKDFLALCDDLRDVKLWDHGIYLEDSLEEGQPALVRRLDRELIRAREEKEQRDREKAEAKAKREREAEEERRKKAEQAKINPLDLFKTEEYTEWDDEGLPTKDKEGKPLPKNASKKLKKALDLQKKAHEAWLKESSNA